MSCPDDNVFAQVQSGLLVGDELSAFHQHLDECPACLELASVLVCMDGSIEQARGRPDRDILHAIGEPAQGTTKAADASSSSAIYLRTALAILFVCHAYSSFVLLPILWGAFRADVPPGFLSYGALHDIWLPFVLAFESLGLLLASMLQLYSIYNLRRAAQSLRSYAILALLTGFLAPVGFGVLVTSGLRQRRH